MEEQKRLQINLDPNLYTIGNISVAFDEEQFILTVFSGNQARQFSMSPKHAKRLSMLLEKNIFDYEAKFGKLATKLPEKMETKEDRSMGF
jgi:hypothetical protein